MELLDLELELVRRITVLVAQWAEHAGEDIRHKRALMHRVGVGVLRVPRAWESDLLRWALWWSGLHAP